MSFRLVGSLIFDKRLASFFICPPGFPLVTVFFRSGVQSDVDFNGVSVRPYARPV